LEPKFHILKVLSPFHFISQASGLQQQIDPRLIVEINRLTNSEGVVSVSEMRRQLNTFVTTKLFANSSIPSRTNKRFFPTRAAINNHIYAAIMKQQLSSIDQENVEKKIKMWQIENPEDKFKFRPYLEQDKGVTQQTQDEDMEEDTDNDNMDLNLGDKALLFVHQTKWQQRLLNLYGSELALLDATYKTTKYALPLFFLVVKTNIDYQIVGSFVTQSETTEAIKEAQSGHLVGLRMHLW
jgi:hypothetical protein